MERMAKKENTAKNIDFSVPIDRNSIKVSENDCLGKLWDMGSRECPVCAMNDICGVLYQTEVDNSVSEIESRHAVFLDKTDFDNINQESLLFDCLSKSGEMTVQELVDRVKMEANTVDDVAIVEWIKKFKAANNLKFTNGKIWKPE